MPGLREVQAAMLAAILDDRPDAAVAMLRAGGLSPERRLRIHRNNHRAVLAGALRDIHPAVAQLVGDACFDGLAAAYVATCDSRSANVHDYGAGFAVWLRGVDTLAELPWLADVARLEYAWHEVFHAPAATPLDAAALAAAPPQTVAALRVALVPAARRVVSPWPVLAIWEANRPGGDASRTIRLDAGGDRLLVARRGIDMVVERLDAAADAVSAACESGSTLGQACATAIAAGHDPAPGLARLLAIGALAASDPSVSGPPPPAGATDPTDRGDTA